MTFVRTTYTNETELIKDMFSIYNSGLESVDLDPTYSKGVFWKNLTAPNLKFDLHPQVEGVVQSDCTELPLEDSSINTIMFDPPFVMGQGKSTNGIMRNRFSSFKDVHELQAMYYASLVEFHRILKKGGSVFFKCQDSVNSGKQRWSHVYIINTAYELGYEVDDMFIYVREKAIIDPKWKKQLHAKKTHCYYLVLRKK